MGMRQIGNSKKIVEKCRKKYLLAFVSFPKYVEGIPFYYPLAAL